MDRFSEIMQTVLKWEGGFVNHPHDPGGATNFGITHKVLAEWRGVASVTPNEVKNMSKEEAIAIFRDRYWTKIKGDRLPPPIDFIVMDGAVNHGVPNMLRMLQEAVGVAASGQMGDDTISAVTAQTTTQESVIDLAVKLADARKARYTNHPKSQHFIRGWRNRLNDVMSAALKPYPVSWSFKDGRSDGAAAPGAAVASEPPPVSSVPQSAIDDDDLQAALTEWGVYAGDIDGMFGPKSVAALDALLTRQSAIVGSGWEAWPLSRRKIALGQLICRDLDIDVGRIDGLFGTQTKAAFENFNRKKNGLPLETWRDELDELPAAPPAPVVTVVTTWPRQRDVPNVFGRACHPPMKRLALPFKMKIAWDLRKEITGFMIHEKVHDSAARVLAKVHAHYGDDGVEEIGVNLFGGCFACRPIRGGSTFSMHSWAIAIDFDPGRNQLRWSHRQARLAKPDAAKFWEFWEEEGWLSLGRARDFDWMHVQAARL
jgi:lysozyme family protein